MPIYGKHVYKDLTKFPVRKRLLRRIEDGEVCGFVRENGTPCLSTPVRPGKKCFRHETDIDGLITGKNRTSNILMRTMQACMSPEDAAKFEELYGQTDSLEDIATVLRMRIHDIQRRHGEGTLTDEKFTAQFVKLSDELRKTLETNAKLKAQADPVNLLDDVYDPTVPNEPTS